MFVLHEFEIKKKYRLFKKCTAKHFKFKKFNVYFTFISIFRDFVKNQIKTGQNLTETTYVYMSFIKKITPSPDPIVVPPYFRGS